MKALYKYPQPRFRMTSSCAKTSAAPASIRNTKCSTPGVFDQNRYFDVYAEYAKNSPDDILIRITDHQSRSRSGDASACCRRCGREIRGSGVACTRGARSSRIWPLRARPRSMSITSRSGNSASLASSAGQQPEMLFTENETNTERLFNLPNYTAFVKDAFHRFIIHDEKDAINPNKVGTKSAMRYVLDLPTGGQTVIRLRLFPQNAAQIQPFGAVFRPHFPGANCRGGEILRRANFTAAFRRSAGGVEALGRNAVSRSSQGDHFRRSHRHRKRPSDGRSQPQSTPETSSIPPKKPGAGLDPAKVRQEISDMIRKEFLPGYKPPGGSKSTG